MTVLGNEFYYDCWSHWTKTRGLGFEVQDKMPIPYFGDIKAFMSSKLRVMTVALNPNKDIFPCTHCTDVLSPKETERRLSSYFREREEAGDPPVWFSSYRDVLEGARRDYLSRTHGAIHVDLCSPIATDPTWSKLRSRQRSHLLVPGQLLFSNLCARLRPHLVFVSVSRKYVARQWGDPRNQDWSDLNRFDRRADDTPRDPNYVVRYKVIGSKAAGKTMVVFGKAHRTPFGEISAVQRRDVGRRAVEVLLAQ